MSDAMEAAAEAVARKWNSDVVLAKDRRVAEAAVAAWLEHQERRWSCGGLFLDDEPCSKPRPNCGWVRVVEDE